MLSRLRHVARSAPLVLDSVAAAFVAFGAAELGLVAHLAAGASAAALALASVRGASSRSAALSAALLVMALPVVGAAIVVVVLLPSWALRQSLCTRGMIEIDLPDPLADVVELDTTLPAAGRRPIRELLRDPVSLHDRVGAVMALRHMDARRAVPLLRLAFSHPNEDLRLLAFAILERREKRLRARIKATEHRLDGPSSSDPKQAAERSAWHRRLAREYWELVYGGFVSPDVEGAVLGAAARHASAASGSELDAKTAILLARIHLRQRRPDEAWACLEAAERAGVAFATCAPLFAEAAYMMRRFSEIPGLLARAKPTQLRRPGLAPVADFWAETRHS